MFPTLKQESTQALVNWKNKIEKIVEEGIQKGEIKPTDKERFACLFVALVEGTVFFIKSFGQTTLHSLQHSVFT